MRSSGGADRTRVWVVFSSLVGGCWASAPKPPPAPKPIAAPVDYELPAPVRAALANEQLAGIVTIPSSVALHATAAAARADHDDHLTGPAISLAVVRDHGDVVEVSTGPVTDCARDFPKPYVLKAFVRRDQLLLRSNIEVTKTYADGTAVAIDRGAPIDVTPTGLAWHGDIVSPIPPQPDVVYSMPSRLPVAALPPPPGERLACDGRPCRVYDPRDGTPRPTLNGVAVAWPDDSGIVMTAGKGLVADIEATCGRVRIAVPPSSVSPASKATFGPPTIRVWLFFGGAVTWQDGSPAGMYNGISKYRQVVEEPDRLCVNVPGIAELVCHDKKTAKSEMSDGFGVD